MELVIAEHAAHQHGVFSREQARDAGFSSRMIGYRVKLGRWIAVDFNVYRAATTPTSWHLVLMAACLAGPAVASHRAAARLWGFPGIDDAPAEVTAYRHRRRTPGAIVWHESWFLDDRRDVTELDGIPITSATRTIVDLSRVISADALEIALDSACHRGLTSLDKVGDEIERLRRRVGTARVRSVLDRKAGDHTSSAESPLESRTAIILRESGLPSATPQFEIYEGGLFVARVDFAWPDQHVILEVDGFAYHGHREAFERDLARQSRLAAAGWRVLRITRERLKDPATILAELHQSLCAA